MKKPHCSEQSKPGLSGSMFGLASGTFRFKDMKKLLTIFLISALWSCGPNFYLRKAERALKKAEQLGANVSRDTIFIEKVVTVPEVKTDTVFSSSEGDTVYISKDRLKLKYVNLPGDSVFIEGKCESDTVRLEIPVTITKEISAKSWLKWWHLVIALLLGGFLVWVKRPDNRN
jgi:hypothetical protein